jgi:YjbE family integral membrane protein
MDILSLQFLYALGAIVLIDLVLAGDNAIVIALAARKLPPNLQKKAIIWGTVGAIAVRTLLTVVVVWLLKIPGLLLAGGALLLWIAVKLLVPNADDHHDANGVASTSFLGAMKTIVVADAVMGLDNVLAVAGAAHGSFLLVTLGLLISIPIVVWGSTLILKWVERFPIIVYAGAGVLALTAAKMMLSEPLLETWVAPLKDWSWLLIALIVCAVLALGYRLNHRSLSKTSILPSTSVSPSPTHESTTMNQDAITLSTQQTLIPVDGGQPSLAAIRRFIQERAFAGPSAPPVTVHLLHVTPRFSKHITRHLPRGARGRFVKESAEQAVLPATRLLELAGIPYEVHLHASNAISETILDSAKRLGCSQIILGSQRNNAFSRFLRNSVTSKLLARSEVPVEVVLQGEASKFQRWALPAGAGAVMIALIAD